MSTGRGRGRGRERSQSNRAASSSSLSREFEERVSIQPTRLPPTQTQQEVPTSSASIRAARRPGYGRAGRKCKVRANHYLVKVDTSKEIWHYDVSIKPEVASRAVNRDIVNRLVELNENSHLGNRKPAFDGRKGLYTAGKLPFDSKDFIVKLIDNNGSGQPLRERSFTVTIKFASRPDLYHLHQFLAGRQFDLPHESLQALDVVLRETHSARYIPAARSFFSPEFGQPSALGEGLECWRGFYQSVRPTQMGLSLNVDMSQSAFYEPISVIDFVSQSFNIRDHSKELSDHEKSKIKKALRGVRVVAVHAPSKRKYRIVGLSALPPTKERFVLSENNESLTIAKYFKQRYNYHLQNVTWPCLQVGSGNKPTYLPMEICQIAAGQRYSKKLNERQVTAILRAACQRPWQRQGSIEGIVAHNNLKKDKYAKEFGIDVHDQLVSFEARILSPPELYYFERGQRSACRPSVGAWNMINKKLVHGAEVISWACVNFSRCDIPAINKFCHELVRMCDKIGMVFRNKPPVVPICTYRSHQIDIGLKEINKQCTTRMGAGKKLQLLIIILPEASGSYGTIKRICDTELGIISQCCRPKNVYKLSNQYFENVALKINVKMGGRNTVLVDAVERRIPLVSDKPTIIFGADVTHPPPGEDSSPSVAAVVASMDWPEVTNYRCLVSAQEHRVEMIQHLYRLQHDSQRGIVHGGLIRDQLIAYRKATGYKPSRIIFYRDGVSEGQFKEVLLYEMDAIRKACQSLQSDYLPLVTFIVVQKRHHTRVFPADNNTDKSGNILPGTIIDTTICHPTEFDFYLCSHAGIQGTSKPTHYHVLFDENNFTADGLQALTNNLCYTFARCTRSVSVVPPAYYAHLGAYRARYYVESLTSDTGSVGSSVIKSQSGSFSLPEVKENVKEFMFYC